MNCRVWSVLLSGLMMGVATGGCGSSGSSPDAKGGMAGDGGSASAVMPQDFFKEVASASCNHLFKCCKPAELSAQMLTSVENCVLAVTAFGSLLGDLKQSVTDKRAVYDEKAAASCVADIANAPCAGTVNMSNPMAPYASCTAAVKGQVAIGGTCKSGWDCAGGATCEVTAAPGDGGIGGGGTGTCAKVRQLGEPCTFSFDCQDGLACDDTGKCGPKKATGADCTFADDCAGGACVNNKCAVAPPMCTGK